MEWKKAKWLIIALLLAVNLFLGLNIAYKYTRALKSEADSLRAAIADYETRRGMACTMDNILVTVGATGALNTALTGLLNPGDEVIIPIPAFPLYESIATAAGAVPVFLDLQKSNFQIDKAALEALVKKLEQDGLPGENDTVFISHGDCPEEAEQLAEQVCSIAKPKELIICPHEPFTGCHVGPGMLALFFPGTARLDA